MSALGRETFVEGLDRNGVRGSGLCESRPTNRAELSASNVTLALAGHRPHGTKASIQPPSSPQ